MDKQIGTTQTTTAPAPTWQRWSLFFAKSGYSDLELSTFMTAQKIHHAAMRAEARQPRFEVIHLAELPLTMAAAAD